MQGGEGGLWPPSSFSSPAPNHSTLGIAPPQHACMGTHAPACVRQQGASVGLRNCPGAHAHAGRSEVPCAARRWQAFTRRSRSSRSGQQRPGEAAAAPIRSRRSRRISSGGVHAERLAFQGGRKSCGSACGRPFRRARGALACAALCARGAPLAHAHLPRHDRRHRIPDRRHAHPRPPA